MNSTRRPRRALRTLLIVAAILLALVAGFFGYQAIVSRPAGEPQAVEFEQATISDQLTAATVLALGEATHGTSQFQLARVQLLAKVADKGFTTIALEEDAGTASKVDAWLQGGPGTAEEATSLLSFRIYRTKEMAELLSWIRDWNDSHDDAEHIRLYGVDEPSPGDDKQIVLDWLGQVDADVAQTFATRLTALTNDSWLDPQVNDEAKPVVAELLAAVEQAVGADPDDEGFRALLSAHALVQGRERATSSAPDLRDQNMAAQLQRIVEYRATQGGEHTLLFAHNGHVDKAGQASAVSGVKMGQLAAELWGDGYKAIGTDARVAKIDSMGDQYSLTVNSPIRGIFAGTQAGYLEFAAASQANQAVLDRTLPMVSAGEPFVSWYALLPMFHQVQVVPSQAWDALIYYQTTTPTQQIG